MDEQAVRDRAQSLCDALVSGDIGLASELFSKEPRQAHGGVKHVLSPVGCPPQPMIGFSTR